MNLAISPRPTRLFQAHELPSEALRAGFRTGARGTHSSRTLMFDDLAAVFSATPPLALRADYVSAITDGNCLGKPTASTRKLSIQRLTELYALDPAVAIFRVFRRLWFLDIAARPLLALLCSIARDPLLAATVAPVLSLVPGAEFQRGAVKKALHQVAGERFNESIMDKVVRNAASSWQQSGHLEGRTFKKRRKVTPSAASAVFAIYLAYLSGFRGSEIFTSDWFAVLDCSPGEARELAVEAKRLGLIDLRMAGDVVDLNLDRLDPGVKGV